MTPITRPPQPLTPGAVLPLAPAGAARALPPAAVPPGYRAIKRPLMRGLEKEFAALRRLDARLRWAEIAIFLLAWLGSATLSLSALALAPAESVVAGLASFGLKAMGILAEYLLLAALYALLFTRVPAEILLYAWIFPACFTAYIIGLWGLTQHALSDPGDPLLASRSELP